MLSGVLRNTPEAIAMVIYTGEECKIRMNANKNPRIKAPSLQAVVNKVVVIVVLFVIFLALFNTIAYHVFRRSTEKHAWYLRHAHVSFGPIITSFIIMVSRYVAVATLWITLADIPTPLLVQHHDPAVTLCEFGDHQSGANAPVERCRHVR